MSWKRRYGFRDGWGRAIGRVKIQGVKCFAENARRHMITDVGWLGS
jgi:hypothetical protein